MPFLDLKAKSDVVVINRKSRGKFPGEIAKSGTIGVVWSKWLSNSLYQTQKISILTEDNEIKFTTVSCSEPIGKISDFPDLEKTMEKHCDDNFIPIFCFLKTGFINLQMSKIEKREYIQVQLLFDKRVITVPTSCIHFKDLKEVYALSSKEKFFCIRVEPWFLEKRKII